ncbi:metallophosphoesterase [bacterium]|nr:metallophosphoesterase [bacterium]
MRPLLIAQFSDLHLGASLGGGRLALPPGKATERLAEQRGCLEAFVGYVREKRPDLVLMPGDLFDDGEPSIDDLNFVINAVNRMAPTQVFIAPGNHDGYTPASGYCTESALYQTRGGPKWGNHVHIFTGWDFETLPMPHHESVTVTGAAFQRHMPEDRRLLADLAPAPEQGIHLLLFHGSLLSYPHTGDDKVVLPFTEAELDPLGYHYAAVGHYHHGGPIRGAGGNVLGAYAGAAFATSLADEGPAVGRWLEVHLTPGEAPTDDALQWHRADKRVVRRVEMNVSGHTDTTALGHALDEALAAAGAEPDDIVYVVLRGRIAHGLVFEPQEPLAGRFHHAVVDDRAVEPDYDIDFAAPLPDEPGLAATSEDAFRWKMLELYHEADTDDARQRVREALFYGLDALTHGEIHLR